MKYYMNFWMNCFNFTGKATRKEYWIPALINYLFPIDYFLFLALLEFIFGDTLYQSIIAPVALLLLIIYYIAALIATISCSIRRIRDAGFPWFLIFINVILIAIPAYIVLLCTPTDKYNQNRT